LQNLLAAFDPAMERASLVAAEVEAGLSSRMAHVISRAGARSTAGRAGQDRNSSHFDIRKLGCFDSVGHRIRPVVDASSASRFSTQRCKV
jgi:hypothetical protein